MKRIIYQIIIWSLCIGILGCDDNQDFPNLNDTYKLFGVSSFSDDRGKYISATTDGGFILGGETTADDITSAYLVKVNSEGEAQWRFVSTDDGEQAAINTFHKVLESPFESDTYYALVDKLSGENGKIIPQVIKVKGGLNSSAVLDTAKENFFRLNKIEFQETFAEEIGIDMINIPNTNDVAILTNLIDRSDKNKIRLSIYTITDAQFVYKWDRIYGFDNSSSSISELNAAGFVIKGFGSNNHYVIAGNLNLDTGTKIFTLEVDELGNEVDFNFPVNTTQIENRQVESIAKIDEDRFAIITNQKDSINTQISKSSYVTILENGSPISSFYNGSGVNFYRENCGKKIQVLDGSLIFTGLADLSQDNPISSATAGNVIYKKYAYVQKVNFQGITDGNWGTTAKRYYYAELATEDDENKTINIGNIVSTANNGYAVIGTQELISSSKMVLMLLDQDGNLINPIQ